MQQLINFHSSLYCKKTNFHLTQHHSKKKKNKIKIMSMSCKKNYNTEREYQKKTIEKSCLYTLYILYQEPDLSFCLKKEKFLKKNKQTEE